ncbi:MAG TPA: GNAT family N-acetyltransferase [Acidimicrobiales bacterium]|jgi:GNAT superfamily N-acetyltransferase|nr:GNAT family N-acetyltransferase [Acidimicrobiales bacterium]
MGEPVSGPWEQMLAGRGQAGGVIVGGPTPGPSGTTEVQAAGLVVVERVGLADLDEVRSVRFRALQDAPEAFGSTLAREHGLSEVDWHRRLTTGAWWLARQDGRVVGLVAGIHPEGTQTRELVSMWVDPTARGEGVADLLVGVVFDWARAEGAEAVTLWVVDGNRPAERLYQRVGFVPTGIRVDRPGDPPRIENQMMVRLASGGQKVT